MGGLAAALLADLLGGVLLIVGGPGAIWRTLWVFWAQSAAAGIVAAVSLRSGMASLSDDAWLAYAAQSLDAEARRGPSEDQTPYQHALEVQRRRERLAALAALDRRRPEGAAAFARARTTEGNLASGIFGCVFVGFSIAHAVFLLMLGLFQAVFAASIHFVGTGGFDALPSEPTPLVETAGAEWLPPLLIVMGLVFAVGLSPLRRRGQMAEGEAAMKEALTRTFILQFVLILGSIPAIVLGSVPLAVVFVLVKAVADAYPLWRRRQSIRR